MKVALIGASAAKGGEFLEILPAANTRQRQQHLLGRLRDRRKDKELDWTFLSPSAVIAPGERTGKFRCR
jgi:putative NADH-flavin reductase